VPESARQAQLALARAHEQGQQVVVYGDDQDDVGFLPRSVDDTRILARKVLGPLNAHDKQTSSALVSAVRVFLRNDRARQRSADELKIHRQTLVYRLRRVEELTGLKPTSTEGSAMLARCLRGRPRQPAPRRAD
jgi:purine catabolism regulator